MLVGYDAPILQLGSRIVSDHLGYSNDTY